MNNAVKTMIENYNCKTLNDYNNALKEIIQEIALLGLWRAKFFEHASFYGDSALRILYNLDRFSEDLDFSLLKKNNNFNIIKYCKAIESELSSFGFSVSVENKVKKNKTNIESAFIKGGTLQNLIKINIPDNIIKQEHNKKIMKIKLEVDTNPPLNFETDVKFLLNPIPFSVKTYKLSSLFAGKLHAVLCRSWGNRVKGRDYYDFIWYLSKNIPVNLLHLESRMKQSGHLKTNENLNKELLIDMLKDKIQSIDFSMAKNDVRNFIKDPSVLDIWSQDFFISILDKLETN